MGHVEVYGDSGNEKNGFISADISAESHMSQSSFPS